MKLRVLSVYVPHNNKSQGKFNAFSQQQDALLKMGIRKDPISVFWEDLWQETEQWVQDGEQIIMAGDWNQDVRNESFKEKFSTFGLIPSITDRHGDNGPETYSRGSNPIDEIFVSASLNITSCGYLDYGNTLGDHRPIWIDIKKNTALGSKLPNLPNHQARRLKTTDPRVVKKYNDYLEKYCISNNLYLRAKNLFVNHSTPLSKENELEYEKIDKIKSCGMVQAERQCRHLYLGGVQWSPILQLARNRILYFKLSIGRKNGRKIHARTLVRLSKKIGINASQYSLEQLIINLQDAYTIYNQIKDRHMDHRKSHLERIANAKEEAGQGKSASHLKSMLHREEQRRIFRKSKLSLHNNTNLRTNYITVTQEDGTKEEITNQKDMENAIIEENIKKYHQSEQSCPFLKSPLVDDFGFHGEGPGTNQVYNGTYQIPPGVDKYTAAFIKACKKDDRTRREGDAKFSRTPQEFTDGWKKTKETTSSSGFHFGHYKATIDSSNLMALLEE